MHEIELLFNSNGPEAIKDFPGWIAANKAPLLEILTTKTRKPRAKNGTRTRKSNAAVARNMPIEATKIS